MSGSDFELLLQRALHAPQSNLYDQPVSAVFQAFDQAESRVRQGGAVTGDLHFTFEKIRLGVAISLLQIFIDLGGDVNPHLLAALQKATKATSTAQMDSIIQKESKAFDQLFQNLYINTEGELILDLFARTLEADSRREMDQIVKETLQALDTLEFPAEEE